MKIPFYEIYYANILNPTILDYITYKLYRHNKNNRFDKIIYWLDKIKFKHKHSDKLIETIELSVPIYVESALDGYNPVYQIHRTVPYIVYELILENGCILECADNHLVYSSLNYIELWKYIKDLTINDYILTEYGWSKVKSVIKTNDILYMADMTVESDTHSLLTNSILSHNTTTTVAYFLWYMIFHADRNLLITANKEKTTKEILSKLKDALKGLPFWLKPGIDEVSKFALRLENGSNIRAVATTGDSATGDSINILMIDEAALIPQNVIKEFWASVFPTMSSFKQSLIIVMSTPRGRQGLYYDLYDGAIKGKNGFVHKRVDWWQVPGHDEAWKEALIAVFGQDLWDREFALSFDTEETRLIPPEDFQFMEYIKKIYKSVNIYGVPKRVCDKIYWHPYFNPDQLTYTDLILRRFVCIVDTAEGKEKGEYGKEDADYNVINIFELQLLSPCRVLKNRLGYKAVKQKNVIRMVLVGVYIDNNKDEEECALALLHIAFDIFKNGQGEIDNMKILYETNFNGKNFKNIFVKHDMYYDSIIKGFTTTGGEHGKKYFCELTLKYIALKLIIISQDNSIPVMSTIELLKTFGKVKNSYAGLCAHDDLAITVMWCSRFFENDDYFEWLDDWFSSLPYYDYSDNMDKLKHILQVLNMMSIYDTNMDDEDIDDTGVFSAAASGFGLITQNISGTYGLLIGGLQYNTNHYNNSYSVLTYNNIINNPVTKFKNR